MSRTLPILEADEPATWLDALDAFTEYSTSNSAKRTVEYYIDRIGQLLKWLGYERLRDVETRKVRWEGDPRISLQDFSGRNMTAYLNARKLMMHNGRAISDLTRRHDAIVIKRFLTWCAEAEQNYIDRDPLHKYKVPAGDAKQVGCPTTAEVKAFIMSIKRRWDADRNPAVRHVPPKRRRFQMHRNIAFVAGMVDTGSRPGELCSLKLSDYNPDALTVTFRETKTKRDRTVPISQEWVNVVNEWLKVRPKKCNADTLFITEYGDPVSVGAIGKILREQRDYAKLNGWSLHGLRHYSASQIAQGDIFVAQYILGHSSITTTQIYAHAQEEHVRKIHVQTAALASVMSADEETVSRPIIVNKRTVNQKAAKTRRRIV